MTVNKLCCSPSPHTHMQVLKHRNGAPGSGGERFYVCDRRTVALVWLWDIRPVEWCGFLLACVSEIHGCFFGLQLASWWFVVGRYKEHFKHRSCNPQHFHHSNLSWTEQNINDMRYLLFTVHSTATAAGYITVVRDTQYGYFSANTDKTAIKIIS